MNIRIPEWRRLEISGAQSPFATAYLRDVPLGVDLSRWDYVEEEYLVSSVASTYVPSDSEPVVTSDQKYTTRLLVRRPRKESQFSGRLFFEGLHPNGDTGLTWESIHPWLLRSGHAWAGVSIFGPPIEMMKAFAPDRYRDVSVGSDGLRWDILSQAAALLRSRTGPLSGVTRTFASGWSYTGSLWRTYVGEGFHERRGPDEPPLFDGYVFGISSGAVLHGLQRLHPDAPVRGLGDPRRIVSSHDVPIVELLSESEGESNETARREDSDQLGDRYRLYEVAGAAHINPCAANPQTRTSTAQLVSRGLRVPITRLQQTPNCFPMGKIACAVFHHLEAWASSGIAPPRAARFSYGELLPDDPYRGGQGRALARDVHGNALGGVRSPHVDVPVATYFPHSTVVTEGPGLPHPEGRSVDVGFLTGHKVPFERQKLIDLYGNPARYAELVERRVSELVDEGWLLRPEGQELAVEARHVEF